MQETEKKSYVPLIAGALYALVALLQLLQMFRYMGFSTTSYIITSLIRVGAYAVLAFALVTRSRNILLPVGFALHILLDLYDWSLISFIYLLGDLAMAFWSVVFVTDYLPQFRERLQKLWFLPAALVTFASILSTIYIISIGGVPTLQNSLIIAAEIAGAFLTSAWMAYPDGFPTQAPTARANPSANSDNSSAAVSAEAYCGLVKHILLLIFTFGIWLLIWIYRVTGYTNNVDGEEKRNPTNKLLLCMFVPFYQIYWTYKTAQRIDKMAAAKGISSDLATLCLILEIFVPIIPPILMQDKINAIVTAPAAAQIKTGTVETKNDTVEELKRYKELLDSGVITQEEFDAKKKQLLGL